MASPFSKDPVLHNTFSLLTVYAQSVSPELQLRSIQVQYSSGQLFSGRILPTKLPSGHREHFRAHARAHPQASDPDYH